ncbi:hypothetical protein ALC53_05952 [Atta colombica]|uniref:Uncharacterized protein n=1 Tax=Atta colombica TaxID=520822 RepID=A0A195BG34_9HYME|nr:hypothetical protein ALC53_05952 [Atta colombica]
MRELFRIRDELSKIQERESASQEWYERNNCNDKKKPNELKISEKDKFVVRSIAVTFPALERRIGANPQADFDFAKDRRDVTLMPLVPQDLN